ncbi:sugar ABC transporter permease [Paenibacillus sp. YN15]|nr:sugar ABC transporter permease [Paenibacillus sp. YN15]
MHTLERKWGSILLGMIPALLIYSIFCIFPIFISFYYSFMDWNGLSTMSFIGLDNFKEVLRDSIFWKGALNNLYVVLASVFGQVPIALGVALLLNSKLKFLGIFRTIGFLPVVISSVIVSVVWNMIYNYEIGPLNGILRAVGLDSLARNWLGEPATAMGSVNVTIVWQFIGMYLVILLAALQNIPSEIYEAAEIDGATGWQRTWRITLPMLKSTILVCVMLCISGSLRTFDLIYAMTNGGPFHSTEVMAIYMYNETFSSLRYGYGSAVSLLIFIFSFVLIMTTNKLLKPKDD